MDPESPMQETVYGTPNDESHVMSEKVQTLANNIYKEWERMIEQYDEGVVKELMPLVVSVLESLDSAVMDNQEHEVELELLREDNEQLMTQYEREKQLRRNAEQRLLEIEYSTEDDHRDLTSKVESLESIVRMLELKSKNSCDHASRLEEKEADMKKEYAKLHERYTELFKTHMDYMERTKILFGTDRIENLTHKPRSLHFSHLKSDALICNANAQEGAPKSLNSCVEMPSMISPNQNIDPNASLKSELQGATNILSPTTPDFVDNKPIHKSSKKVTERGQLTDRVSQSDQSTGTRACWVEEFDSNLQDISVTSPEIEEVEELNNFSFAIDGSSFRSEHRRPNTLYQELSFQDSDALGEMDEGADMTDSESEADHDHKGADTFFGMGKEVENLISENNELLATKNALNIVKDDLIAKVDELTSEQEILREELKSYMSVKEKLKQKVAELEEELKRVKEEADKNKSSKSDDEEDVPMAQRKRFTRVEMARVLMERNQYKERLIELQEAVRWTEMIRASRSDSSLDTKRNKSSVWKFFSDLFNSNEKPPRKPPSFVNVHYNAPTSSSSPALDTMRRKRLGDRHRGLDLHESDISSERMHQQRARERREQYKQVRAHVRKEDGRLQAYGWSLPTKATTSGKGSNSESTSNTLKPNASVMPVPVPVYCRPLLEKDPGMKVWCAAGVNMSGGKVKTDIPDVSVVGGSMFYCKDPRTISEVDKLSQELEDTEKLRQEHGKIEESHCSIVWLCTSAHSNSSVVVIDANNPAEILDSFHVCTSHLLCITSVPGIKESDFPADDAFMKLGTVNKSGLDKSETVQQMGAISLISCQPEPIESAIECTEAKETLSTPSVGPMHKSHTVDGINTESLRARIVDPLLNCNDSMDDGSGDDIVEKMPSVLPTMWLGSQAGNIYVHSSVAQWWRCIHTVKLQDSVLSIVHVRGRVFAALADGTVAVFHRGQDGQWDLTNYHKIDLGHPHHSIRCMTTVNNHVWCGYRNCIRVVDAQTLDVIDSFDAHPRKESQVRQLSWAGDGVWVTIRLDSTLRLYHAHTHQHLQDVDIEPYVSKMLGTGKLGFSFVRITALLISCKRLWMGTGNGVVISVPLTESSKSQLASDALGKAPGGMVRVYSDNTERVSPSSFVPYCSMAQAQLSFHGHRDAVKFFVAVPGQDIVASTPKGALEAEDRAPTDSKKSRSPSKESKAQKETKTNTMLILSGGEGYIDFRVGDGDDDEILAAITEDERKPLVVGSKTDKSHLIVWQVAA